jgi:hypothetical protein
MIGGTLNVRQIQDHWDEILRVAASIKHGSVTALADAAEAGKLSSAKYGLALALRKLGRIERTLFILDYYLNRAMANVLSGAAKLGLVDQQNYDRGAEHWANSALGNLAEWRLLAGELRVPTPDRRGLQPIAGHPAIWLTKDCSSSSELVAIMTTLAPFMDTSYPTLDSVPHCRCITGRE